VTAYESLSFPLIKLYGAAFLIGLTGGQGSVNQHENGMRDGNQGTLLSSCSEPPETLFEEAVFFL
jgi:hypothetical protein